MSLRTLSNLFFVPLFVLGLVLTTPLAQAGVAAQAPAAIEADLVSALADGPSDFFVEMQAKADLSQAYEIEDWEARGWYVYNTLKAFAGRSQAPVIEYARQHQMMYQSFFGSNTVYIRRGKLENALRIANLPGVERLYVGEEMHIQPQTGAAGIQAVEIDHSSTSYGWNLGALNPASGLYGMQAAQVWSDYDVRGSGIVVANIDTGVTYTHPALVRQYRGTLSAGVYDHDFNWYQPVVEGCGDGTYPCDHHGHGSGTMGIMVGETADLVEQIGAAPQARWIACMGCTTAMCSEVALRACGDWMLAPCPIGAAPGDPSCDAGLRPHVINNSWGGDGCDTWYRSYVQAWVASGQFPAFSAGNIGGCGDVSSPGDNPEAFSTAAHNSLGSNVYTGGPSCFFPEPSCDPGAHQVDPHVNAPTFVRTANRLSGYTDLFSGTSAASPHTAATVALLWSANPALIGSIDRTFTILEQSANKDVPAGDCGEPACAVGHVPNYEYGWGYLDAHVAVQMAVDVGGLAGTVTEFGTAALLPGVTVAAQGPGGGITTTVTDSSGEYATTLAIGTYTVTFSAPGYVDEVAVAEVSAGLTTTLDVALHPTEPSIAVVPETFAITMPVDYVYSRTMSIVNDGTAALTWSIYETMSVIGTRAPFQPRTDVPWVDSVPASGVTPAAGASSVDVTFDTHGLAPGGCYSAALGIVHDAPGMPSPHLVPLDLCVMVNAPEFHLDKRTTPTTAVPGDVVTFTIAFSNTGDVAGGATLVDALPEGVTFVSAGGGGVYYPPTGAATGTVVWDGLTVNSAGAAVTVTAQVDATTAPAILTNVASLDWLDQQLVATATLAVTEPQQPCIEVRTVTLSLVSTAPIYVDDPVSFQLDLTPNDLTLPYDALVKVNGSDVLSGTQRLIPLPFSYTFQAAGTYNVAISAWNCDMALSDAITGTLSLVVTQPAGHYKIYLPIVHRNP